MELMHLATKSAYSGPVHSIICIMRSHLLFKQQTNKQTNYTFVLNYSYIMYICILWSSYSRTSVCSIFCISRGKLYCVSINTSHQRPITQSGSTVYIGIAQVTQHQPCTFENLSFHFHCAFHFTFEEISVKNR